MRSTLAARIAQVLDSMPGISWEYEPARYADPTGDWLPDFVLDGLPCPLFLEVKGPPQSSDELEATRRSMMRVWSSVPDAGLAIWRPETLDGEAFDVIRRNKPVHAVAT